MKQHVYVLCTLLAIVSLGIMGCELVDPELNSAALQQEAAEQPTEKTEQAKAPTPAASSSAGGFVWKPVSEGDGRLVVLLPSSLRGQVTGCTISGSFGTENGNFAGDTHNGARPHYRFSKPGSGYGTGITVQANLNNGESRTWSVPNGAERTTY